MSHLQRTRFKEDIVAEYGIPQKGNNKLIILLDGMPAMPQKERLMRFLMKRGYYVIHPRYRGSWESGGIFLNVSPHQDVLDIIDELPKGLKSAWDGEVTSCHPDEIIIICSSFGGPAGLLAAKDPRITKVIAFSPVVDWNAESPHEPFDQWKRFIKQGFGEAYRMHEGNLDKLKTGEFYNPVKHIQEIPGEKIYIIHANDDGIVTPLPVRRFAEAINAKILMLSRGGHFGTNKVMHWRIWLRIWKFLKN